MLLASYASIKRIEEHLASTSPVRYQWLLLPAYIIGLFFAEISTSYLNVPTGLGIHAIILFILFLHSSLATNEKVKRLLNSMMILPLLRIIGLSMPIVKIPQLYWFIIIAIPLFAASYTLMKIQGLGIKDVGLTLKRPISQFLIALTGIPLGYIEFKILHPHALIPQPSLQYLLLGFIVMLIGTGLAEEILFRGILQRNSEDLLGAFPGLLYTSLLFTIFHIGWKSVHDLIFVFLVAIFYGYSYHKTRSIIGVTLSHGLSNSILFLFMPFLQ
ncbi:MAG: type II CAAX endopeptidase family protein [Methanothermobacter sp.]|nr:type II CAAX endopeptidase family protein [Methanothermobacter sp.]